MAIQDRRGAYADFDPQKMVSGEWATVTSGDPNASDGRAVYKCFVPGIVKRMATYEDMVENVDNATQEIQDNLTEGVDNAVSNANLATQNANEAASSANSATQSANAAADAANEAAEEARDYVLGDISSKTVNFTQAASRDNIASGESTSTVFGKIEKWFTDIDTLFSDFDSLQDIVSNLFRGVAVSTVNTAEPGVYVYYSTSPDSYAPDNVHKGLLVNFCDPRWPTSTTEQPSYMYQILIVPENNSMYYRIWANGISYGQWYKINVTAAS